MKGRVKFKEGIQHGYKNFRKFWRNEFWRIDSSLGRFFPEPPIVPVIPYYGFGTLIGGAVGSLYGSFAGSGSASKF